MYNKIHVTTVQTHSIIHIRHFASSLFAVTPSLPYSPANKVHRRKPKCRNELLPHSYTRSPYFKLRLQRKIYRNAVAQQTWKEKTRKPAVSDVCLFVVCGRACWPVWWLLMSITPPAGLYTQSVHMSTFSLRIHILQNLNAECGNSRNSSYQFRIKKTSTNFKHKSNRTPGKLTRSP